MTTTTTNKRRDKVSVNKVNAETSAKKVSIKKDSKLAESTKVAKMISSVSNQFANVRSTILAQVANDKTLSILQKNAFIVTLRRSKKDSALYHTLLDLSEFRYSAKTVKDTLIIKKSYSIKHVTNSCELFSLYNAAELTTSLRSAIVNENEQTALKALKETITTAQNNVAFISDTINNLRSDAEKVIIEEHKENLARAQKTLANRVKAFEYLSHASNRKQIK